jgi:hypothetical protein
LRTGESTLLNKDGLVYLYLLSDGIGRGRGLSLPAVLAEYAAMDEVHGSKLLHWKDYWRIGQYRYSEGEIRRKEQAPFILATRP